ncbi:MAG TPA: histidine phosphatase family protein [Candidatus Nitrosopolaris sp.]|nr:histidine phosphatase family protein [Candidatus Nitrosopolaris sp.]
MDLYLLRHGDSGKRMALAAGGNSGDVPLTIVGREEIAIIARSVKGLNLKFSAIVTSPLKRAVQTAKIMAKVLAIENTVTVWNDLVPEGNRTKLYTRLNQYARESSILMIGHEPYLSSMMYEMIFQKNRINQRGRINLKKAGLAKIRIISLTPNISGELRWLLTPRILKLLEKGSSKSKSSAVKKKELV